MSCCEAPSLQVGHGHLQLSVKVVALEDNRVPGQCYACTGCIASFVNYVLTRFHGLFPVRCPPCRVQVKSQPLKAYLHFQSIWNVVQAVRETMEGVIPLAVPLIVNIKVGKRWGSMQPVAAPPPQGPPPQQQQQEQQQAQQQEW